MIPSGAQDYQDLPVENIFVIASDNSWLHVYPDLKSMIQAQVRADSPDSIELFDVRGVRLLPVLNDESYLVGLQESTEKADPEAVRNRLRTAIQAIRETLEQNLAQSAIPRGTRETWLNRLPEIKDQSLEECYTILDPDFGHGSLPGGTHGPSIPGLGEIAQLHTGSWWHNLIAH